MMTERKVHDVRARGEDARAESAVLVVRKPDKA